MTAPMVKIDALSKRFQSGGGLFAKPRTMMAVREVTLSIGKGEVLGVVGESGCGKSTLARLVLRLIEPTSGRVTIDGTDITALSAGALRRIRRRMAMVFQDPYSSLDPRYSLADVLAEPLRLQGEVIAPARVDEMLASVGLPAALAASHPHQLSGGQRQRVGIARALALKPDFVVLDEPTASLDVSIQAQIIALLADLRDRLGLTYLFISHDLGLVRYFCDRIVVMYLGSVVEVLPDTRTAPRHPYTRALMDSNFAPDPARRRVIEMLTGEVPSPFALPPGCAFATRCPRASDRCRRDTPALGGDAAHPVACFHPL
ncbi:ABC transporter ATP-binding protein [Pseudogemmobacter blasticus]|uniref:Peptide ABC transporter ATP-binding protein n=1 Tax=Fuscovulum blasticum DSM 2131 TaxID=1188250 RepID=A0A2T4JC05_FUSBL|nr:ABC transporter ATP-binding protein [Fuscovulum blasticum]PTE15348.1 peptide ABC transporter ATP-binding protein [Fuscovulum blasticum DSM 2131]